MDGYKIIDFKNIPITADSQEYEIPGVYDAIKTSNKPMVITNLVISGDSDIYLKPFFTNIMMEASGVYSTMLVTEGAMLSLTIDDSDQVAITPIE